MSFLCASKDDDRDSDEEWEFVCQVAESSGGRWEARQRYIEGMAGCYRHTLQLIGIAQAIGVWWDVLVELRYVTERRCPQST